MNLKKIEKEIKMIIKKPKLTRVAYTKEWQRRPREEIIARQIAEVLRKAIKQVVESVPVKRLYCNKHMQHFPQKKNPARCQLCDEEFYCTCYMGYEEKTDEIKQWKKKMLKELEEVK